MGTPISCFVACPLYGQVDPHYHLSALKFVQQLNESGLPGAMLPWVGDSAVCRARNGLTRRFLEGDWSHILFIDSDLVFSIEQVQRIMSHPEDVVAGLYCHKKEGDPEIVWNSYAEREPNERGLLSVRYMGTGFIRIARSVFERMIAAWSEEMAYMPDGSPKGTTEYEFWHMGVYKYKDGGRRWLTEDWWFCQRCLDLGIKVWADMHILLRHSGNALYPLQTQEPKLFGKPVNPTVSIERAREPVLSPARL